jgi:triphosphoribosyl-dephospho-CoA synthase
VNAVVFERVPRRACRDAGEPLGRMAVASLHAELALAPKPGLVTLFDTGSHDDMDARTFLRSLFALRHYFRAVARAGAVDAPFAVLRAHGIAAETAMLAATGGINTHRGAIFSLGLLVAAAAHCQHEQRRPASAEAVCMAVQRWAADLTLAPLDARSPGQRACREHAVSGVREQAAAGYPVLRMHALPAMRAALAAGLSRDAARCHTLMVLVATLDDLNLLHRGGAEGLRWARAQAAAFIAAGGAHVPGWQARLQAVSDAFVARRLSPGGSADMLACCDFLLRQEAP